YLLDLHSFPTRRSSDLILELFHDADLTVGVLSPNLRDLNEVTRRARESWLARIPTARSNYQWLLPLEAIASTPQVFAPTNSRERSEEHTSELQSRSDLV